ncbi:MAG: hypothetical protein ACXQT2_07920 [Methanotrichaceae archaeon]
MSRFYTLKGVRRMQNKIEVIRDDITTQQVDAIVNAASGGVPHLMEKWRGHQANLRLPTAGRTGDAVYCSAEPDKRWTLGGERIGNKRIYSGQHSGPVSPCPRTLVVGGM